MHAYSTNDVIYGEAGNDFIGTTGNTRNPTIYGGSGSYVLIDGGAGNDTFWFIESTSASISGGSGGNLYRFDPFYQGGPYHNDIVITDLSNNDTIRLDEYVTDGNGLTWSPGNGYIVLEDTDHRLFAITLQGITDISQIAGVTYRTIDRTATLGERFGIDTTPPDTTPPNTTPADSTLKAGTTSADSIDNSLSGAIIYGYGGNDDISNGGLNVTISGGDGSDYITNHSNGTNTSISGGIGSDTIYNNWDSDANAPYDYNYGANVLFKYSSGDGNDKIYGFNETDTLQIGGGTGTYSSTKSSSSDDIIVTVGNGKITLQGAASLSKVNIAGTKKTTVPSTTLKLTNSSKSPVTIDSAVKTVNASSRTKAVKITGNAKANTILGGSGNDTLYGQAGKDSLSGGSGNDKLYGGAGKDSLSGGSNNDKLYGNAGNNTLYGGTGDDSLWGGDGADKFIYSSGDGKDVIYGFENDDLLKITGTFSATYSKSKDEVYFKVGNTSKAITLSDFDATTFHINSSTYKISGTKLVKK